MSMSSFQSTMLPAFGEVSFLDPWLERCGARFFRPDRPPVEFEGWQSEYQRLTQDWGVMMRPWISLLVMTGEDRVRFLNGLVTCNVAGLEAGTATYGFATDLKGRILSDLVVIARQDRLEIEVPAAQCADLKEHFLRYVIADRVSLEHHSDQVSVTCVGPGLTTSSFPIGWSGPQMAVSSVDVDHTTLSVLRGRDLGGTPRLSMWVESKAAVALFEQLGFDRRMVGYRAWETLRVESGVPLYGRDFDRANFPQETGRDDAVSYEKGCYLGQEVVARIHYRGGVRRLARRVEVPADGDWRLVGEEMMVDGRSAGRLTSLVSAQEGALFRGLAIVHTRVEAGSEVDIGGVPATINEIG